MFAVAAVFVMPHHNKNLVHAQAPTAVILRCSHFKVPIFFECQLIYLLAYLLIHPFVIEVKIT